MDRYGPDKAPVGYDQVSDRVYEPFTRPVPVQQCCAILTSLSVLHSFMFRPRRATGCAARKSQHEQGPEGNGKEGPSRKLLRSLLIYPLARMTLAWPMALRRADL